MLRKKYTKLADKISLEDSDKKCVERVLKTLGYSDRVSPLLGKEPADGNGPMSYSLESNDGYVIGYLSIRKRVTGKANIVHTSKENKLVTLETDGWFLGVYYGNEYLGAVRLTRMSDLEVNIMRYLSIDFLERFSLYAGVVRKYFKLMELIDSMKLRTGEWDREKLERFAMHLDGDIDMEDLYEYDHMPDEIIAGFIKKAGFKKHDREAYFAAEEYTQIVM